VKRGEAKKVDYLLDYKPNTPIAVIEAKDSTHASWRASLPGITATRNGHDRPSLTGSIAAISS
jgi:hypothetical protein